jgi:hypothetical protein
MTGRERPDLNHVRGALREEDERAARAGETATPSQERRTGSYGGASYSLLHETDGLRTFALVLRRGD